MARQSPKPIEVEEPPVEPVTETLTYLPGDGDPPSVKWAGHTFQANVPKEITGHAEGTEREKLNLHLIESARGNRHFKVGNERPKRDASSMPRNADEYRAYVVSWLKDAANDHADAMIRRFAKERELRLVCEVGSDDYAFISSLFMPKLHELAKADELTEGQVAQIWLQNGFNELPW